jgi:GTP cyclohydrolase I
VTAVASSAELERIGRELLVAIGEDPDRDGLVDTPARFARWWTEFIEYDPGITDTAFAGITTDQMVVVSGIKVWSLCEHHLLPFWCDISIGYIARDRVLGLSKFARIAHQCAHRLQVQERLTHQIADEVMRVADSPDVAVLGRGEHLCMTMRGIKSPALMTSSVMRGVFLDKPQARDEFLRLAGI